MNNNFTLENSTEESTSIINQLIHNADVISTSSSNPSRDVDNQTTINEQIYTDTDVSLIDNTSINNLENEENSSDEVLYQLLNNANIINNSEYSTDSQANLIQESLTSTADTLSEQNDNLIWNATEEGLKSFGQEITNAPSNIRTMTSALLERTQPKFLFGESNPDEVYFGEDSTPNIGNSAKEQISYNVSRGMGEALYIMAGTFGGGLVGASFGGAGAVPGAAIGRTATTGSIAAAVFSDTLRSNYKRFLDEGKNKSEAFNKATDLALAESAIEFGSDWILGKLGKVAKLGKVGASKLADYLKALVLKGDVKVSKTGLEFTKAGKESFLNLVKSIAGGTLVEGGEEVAQQGLETIAHRKEGQSWGEALKENKGELIQSGLIGGVAGGISVGAMRGVGKAIDVGVNKLTENSNAKQQEINAALEATIADEKELDTDKYKFNNREYRGEHQLESADSKNILDVDLNELKQNIIKSQGSISKSNNKYLNELNKIQSNPTDTVTVYRAAPKNELNSGDWVTIDRSYATDMAKENGGKVHKFEVPVSSLLYPNNINDLPSLHITSTFQYNTDTTQKETTPKLKEVTPIGNNYGEKVSGNQEIDVQGDTVLTTKESEVKYSDRKQEQFNIIQGSNPRDTNLSNHTWINNKSDIKSFDEVISDEDFTPDYTKEDYNKAKQSGVITVYSSKPIANGESVTPSQQIAKDYAGSEKIYSKEVSINDVAWISASEGQLATNESISQEQQIQNDVNENPKYNETLDQRVKLSNTRKEIAKATDIDNNDIEDSISGSVSDNGYSSSESHPVELTGLSRKDEVPSTPDTNKALIETHNNETQDAFKRLGIKFSDQESGSSPSVSKEKAARKVTNDKVSSIHKYYGIKNFVESVGSAISDRAGRAYNLFVKGELTGKEKRMKGIGQSVQGYTNPAKNNVIRVSNSRDYSVILHETAHHLVVKTKVFEDAIENNKELIKAEHKKLEKINPSYRLNEKAYAARGDDITEEYFVNLFGAYGTDEYTPSKEITDIINKGLNNLGEKATADFNIMRQQFVDYNTLKSRKEGALKVTQNNMEAARKLQRGLFDTTNLNAKQLTTYKKIINYAKNTPRWIIETFFNENYQIEKDARRTGKFKDVLMANQALRKANRIAEAYIRGTGLMYQNGTLHKLDRSRAVKNLARIFREAEALGKGYENKLEALLYAKQTIGESTGNQKKADVLIKLANDLGYENWLDARKDLKLLSLVFESNLYQGKDITSNDINEAVKLRDDINKNYISEENSEAKSVQTDLNSVNFEDPKLIDRLNKIINYVQTKANNLSTIEVEMRNTSKEDGIDVPQVNRIDIKNDIIRDNFVLDKKGSVNTGMTLEDALTIYTDLQSDPKIQQLESLENDVRYMLSSLEDLMCSMSTSTAMQMAYAKEGTGAWYIPLLRFIDVNEEKAIGINLKGSSFNTRRGSNREVLDIYTSIENVIQGIAKHVSTQQAIDYLLALKNEPIFAQYIREVPANSKEVTADLLRIVDSKLKDINDKIKEYEKRGEKLSELPALTNWIDNLEKIKQDIENGNVTSEDARVQLFIENPPTNKNIIQRIEKDGRVHYYLIDDTLKNFIYNQRKNIFSIINQTQWAKDHLGWIQKVNDIAQFTSRASFTVFSLPFQTANFSRDAMDVALKGSEENSIITGMMLPIRYMNNMYQTIKLVGGLLSAKNREEFNRITELFGGAEQTQWKEGEYTANYLDYKINKKGKIVRGGMLGWLETLTEKLGNSDLIPRIVALKQRCKKLGIDLYEATSSYDDYVSLNLPKRILKKYFTNEQIEQVLGKDKAQAWKETKDDEFFPYVPEEFEKEQLNDILHDSGVEEDILSYNDPGIQSDLQDIYDRSSIDFSKGTLSTRSLGKVFLFANTILQGGYQTLQYSATHKKTAVGAFSSMMMLGVLQSVLGWEDDEPSDDTAGIKGFEIKPLGITLPMQSVILLPVKLGNSIGNLIKSNSTKKSFEDLKSIVFDNTLGSFNSPSGFFAIAAGLPTFIVSGELPNYYDSKKYNEFNYFVKLKMRANVDHLTKSMDSLASIQISKFLVDNGIYDYSAHEINRVMQLCFGNAVSQLEGLMGLGSIFNRKENKIDWLDYKWDPIKATINSVTKPFKIKEFPRSPDSEFIDETRFNSMSLYDRFTGQVGTNAKNRIRPEELSEEDRRKYQSYFDKSYLAWKAQENLKMIYKFYSQIDDTKVGADKAKKDITKLYKDLAHTYKVFLDNYNGTPEGYRNSYRIMDEELFKHNDSIYYINEGNKNAPKEKTTLGKLIGD